MSKHTSTWFIGFVGLAAIAVVFMLSNQPDAQTNTTTNTTNTNQPVTTQPVQTPTQTIEQEAVTLSQVTDTLDIGDITTYRFGDTNSLSVMPVAMQVAVLNETPTLETVDITVAGVTGQRLTLSSAKDGSPFTVVQVVQGDTLYDFRGDDEFLDQLDQYITFNQ